MNVDMTLGSVNKCILEEKEHCLFLSNKGQKLGLAMKRKSYFYKLLIKAFTTGC